MCTVPLWLFSLVVSNYSEIYAHCLYQFVPFLLLSSILLNGSSAVTCYHGERWILFPARQGWAAKLAFAERGTSRAFSVVTSWTRIITAPFHKRAISLGSKFCLDLLVSVVSFYNTQSEIWAAKIKPRELTAPPFRSLLDSFLPQFIKNREKIHLLHIITTPPGHCIQILQTCESYRGICESESQKSLMSWWLLKFFINMPTLHCDFTMFSCTFFKIH